MAKIRKTSRGSENEQKKRFAGALLNELETKFITPELCTDQSGVRHKYPTFFTLLTGLLAFIQRNIELLNEPKMYGFTPAGQAAAGQPGNGGRSQSKKALRFEKWKEKQAAENKGKASSKPPTNASSTAKDDKSSTTLPTSMEAQLHALRAEVERLQRSHDRLQ
jgi:hypothetical protein